jgi:hypothetical protein
MAPTSHGMSAYYAPVEATVPGLPPVETVVPIAAEPPVAVLLLPPVLVGAELLPVVPPVADPPVGVLLLPPLLVSPALPPLGCTVLPGSGEDDPQPRAPTHKRRTEDRKKARTPLSGRKIEDRNIARTSFDSRRTERTEIETGPEPPPRAQAEQEPDRPRQATVGRGGPQEGGTWRQSCSAKGAKAVAKALAPIHHPCVAATPDGARILLAASQKGLATAKSFKEPALFEALNKTEAVGYSGTMAARFLLIHCPSACRFE